MNAGFFTEGLETFWRSDALKPRVVRNTAIQGIGQIVMLASGLVINMVLSRYLGVEAFGRFQYVFVFFYFFMTVNDFGVMPVIVREISQNRGRAAEILGAVMIFRTGLSLILIFFAWLLAGRLDYPPDIQRAVRLYAPILLLLSLQLPAVIFQVEMKLALPSILGIVSKVLCLALVLAAVAQRWQITGLIAMQLAADLFYTGALWLGARRYVRPRWIWDTALLQSILRPAFWIGMTGLLTAVVNRIDFVMLERLTDFRQVGMYAAAYRVTNLFETLPIMMMGTIYPAMARLAADDKVRLKRVFTQSTFVIGFTGMALGCGIYFAAPWIISVLFGSDFMSAVPCLRVLIAASILIYWAITSGNLLISLHCEKWNLVFFTLAAAVNIILNFFWIPAHGLLGAAWATVAAYAVLAVQQIGLCIYVLKKI